MSEDEEILKSSKKRSLEKLIGILKQEWYDRLVEGWIITIFLWDSMRDYEQTTKFLKDDAG